MKEDKSTRRAIAMILTPEDNQVMTKEFPCAIGVQYFLRDNRLHAVTFMRAQQALTVFPYDSILFSSAQAAIAHLLGAQVGRYVHCSGTYHFYDSERETAEKIVEEGVQEINLGSIDDYNAGLQHIGIVEQSLRSAVGRGGPGGAAVEKIAEEKIAGGEFFRTIADVLIFYAWCKLGSIEDALQSVREAPRGLSEVLATNVDRFVNR